MKKKENYKEKKVYLYPSGFAGMALYFHKLANALQQNGAQVTLFAYKNYELDDLPAYFEKKKILFTGSLSYTYKQSALKKIFRVLWARLKNLFIFYRAVVRDKPEVTHIQEFFYPLDWMLFFFFAKTSSRIVLTIHDVLPHQFYTRHFIFWEKKALNCIYRRADQLIVHSEANRQQLFSHFRVNPEKVVVIPHGEYSLQGFYSTTPRMSKKEAKKCLGLPYREKVVLFFGHIRQDKGLDVLIKAFREVVSTEKHTTLVIAGLPMQGESFTQYDRLIQDLGIQAQVRSFLKYIIPKDIPLYFMAADFVCLPYTRFFSQSGVLHLAQGFGKAVIVSQVGGLAEVVSHGRNGLLVLPGNIFQLKEAMIYLLQNPALCSKMGKEGFRMSQERFSWQDIAQMTIHMAYQ